MSLNSPLARRYPSVDRSWPAELVSLIDRSLGNRVRFRRLLGLLTAVLAVTAGLTLLAVVIGVPALLTSFVLRR